MATRGSEIFKPVDDEEEERRKLEFDSMKQKDESKNQRKEAELEEFLNSLPVAGKDELDFAFEQPALYYPGAGDDFGPFRRFARDSTVRTLVYCDYGKANVCEIMKDWTPNISDVYEAGSIERIEPDAVGKNSWDEFWPEDRSSHRFSKPINACGFFTRISCKPGNRDMNFIYLVTEGIQTYKILFSDRKVKPKVLVIQDHGMGGNWANFGGRDSRLYEVAKPALPEMIYTERDENVWPGYKRVSEFGGGEGQYNTRRAIYKMGGNRKNDTRI